MLGSHYELSAHAETVHVCDEAVDPLVRFLMIKVTLAVSGLLFLEDLIGCCSGSHPIARFFKLSPLDAYR